MPSQPGDQGPTEERRGRSERDVVFGFIQQRPGRQRTAGASSTAGTGSTGATGREQQGDTRKEAAWLRLEDVYPGRLLFGLAVRSGVAFFKYIYVWLAAVLWSSSAAGLF